MTPQVNLVEVELTERAGAQDAVQSALRLRVVRVIAVDDKLFVAWVEVVHVMHSGRDAHYVGAALEADEFVRVAPRDDAVDRSVHGFEDVLVLVDPLTFELSQATFRVGRVVGDFGGDLVANVVFVIHVLKDFKVI